jgi:hypothetical protein
MAENHTQDIEFVRVYQVTVGGLHIILGQIPGDSMIPPLFAAGFTHRDLTKERCGYGTTEAEAIVDFFRHIRPDAGDPLSGICTPVH